MATTNLKFHRITATSGNTINTSTAYVKGDVYFIKSASGNTGKVYICTTAGTGYAAVLEDYSVDNNTWRGIQDNLTSNSSTDSLSAKQGKILSDTIIENEEITAQAFNDINDRLLGVETKESTAGYLNAISKSGNTLTITPRGGNAFTFTNTTYSRKVAVSEGEALSLVNTGDMYKWNTAYDLLDGVEALLAAI